MDPKKPSDGVRLHHFQFKPHFNYVIAFHFQLNSSEACHYWLLCDATAFVLSCIWMREDWVTCFGKRKFEGSIDLASSRFGCLVILQQFQSQSGQLLRFCCCSDMFGRFEWRMEQVFTRYKIVLLVPEEFLLPCLIVFCEFSFCCRRVYFCQIKSMLFTMKSKGSC